MEGRVIEVLNRVRQKTTRIIIKNHMISTYKNMWFMRINLKITIA